VLVYFLSHLHLNDQKEVLKICLENSPLVLISDIEYSFGNKISLILKGIRPKKLKSSTFPLLEQLSEQLSVNIIQKDNIFALSRVV